MPTVLAAFALLTLPASPDPLRDLDVVTGVEVVLATGGAVQQVFQLARRDLGNLQYTQYKKSVGIIIQFSVQLSSLSSLV